MFSPSKVTMAAGLALLAFPAMAQERAASPLAVDEMVLASMGPPQPFIDDPLRLGRGSDEDCDIGYEQVAIGGRMFWRVLLNCSADDTDGGGN